MPRPAKADSSAEPRKRSRNGCWPCKNKKIKCGEEKPHCQNCERAGEECDYKVRLNWEGRGKKGSVPGQNTFSARPADTSNNEQTVSGARESAMNPPSRPQHQPATFQIYSPGRPASSHHDSRSQPMQLTSARSNSFNSTSSTSNLSRVDTRSRSNSIVTSPETSSSYRAGSLSAGPEPGMRQMQLDDTRRHYYSHPDARHYDAHSHRKRRLEDVDENYGETPVETGPPRPLLPGQRFEMSRTLPPLRIPQDPPPPQPSVFSYDPRYNARQNHRSPYSTLPAVHPPVNPQPHYDGRLLQRAPVDTPHSNTPTGPDSKSPSNTAPPRYVSYGIDHGKPDLDDKNDDAAAIPWWIVDSTGKKISHPDVEVELDNFGYECVNLKTPYYAKPRQVNMPWKLSSKLPERFYNNPMDLLYFHHFINHTARVLVPHDCPENPFRYVLPEMALKDPDLLNLLLAYSAIHRARYLNHDPPLGRVAKYTVNVFTSLNTALQGPGDITEAHLATAIMLASLQIIAPESWEGTVSWQSHLLGVNEIVTKRGGWHTLPREDKVSRFLRLWVSYLEVVGALSGKMERKIPFHELLYDADLHETETPVDCILGFRTQCIYVLAHIADLCIKCDKERFRNGRILTTWQPTKEVTAEARKLSDDLRATKAKTVRACSYQSRFDSKLAATEQLEMISVNDGWMWAGQIHLYRRALGKATDDPEVQNAVKEIVICLQRLEPGGSAENCMVFPIFTAGCSAIEEDHYKLLHERMILAERHGLTQVGRARVLMENVWERGNGVGWEALLDEGEFCG